MRNVQTSINYNNPPLKIFAFINEFSRRPLITLCFQSEITRDSPSLDRNNPPPHSPSPRGIGCKLFEIGKKKNTRDREMPL